MGPSTDYVIIDQLPANAAIEVIGKVKGKPWYMIGAKAGGRQVATGFLHTSLARPARSHAQARSAAPAPMPSGDVQTVTLDVDVKCRELKQSITKNNKTETSAKSKACRSTESDSWDVA